MCGVSKTIESKIRFVDLDCICWGLYRSNYG